MYNTKNKKNIVQNLPMKGMIKAKELAEQTGQALETIYYNLKCLSQDNNSIVGRIKIGLKKFTYFIKQRIDQWILQVLQRINKAVMKLKKVPCKNIKPAQQIRDWFNGADKLITVY
jgi:predicted DNA-binding transcriptional regulator AlpA